jgi:peptidoglycan/LPS O-acetylase OafA/YrhL
MVQGRLSSFAIRSGKKIDALISLRFFLAFQVAVRHTVGTFVPDVSRASSAGWHRFLWREIVEPAFAVSFFFLLSGYVLAMVYLDDDRRVERKRFFVARIARIYPLYLITLIWDSIYQGALRATGAGWLKVAGKFSLKVAANLAMLQAWYPLRLGGIDGPNWSISAEAFFYLCFPVLGVALWRLRGARLWIAAGCAYAGGQALVWLAAPPHLRSEIMTCLPLLHLSTFVLGILLARWQVLRLKESEADSASAWQANAVLAVSLAALWLFKSPIRPSNYDFSLNGLQAPIFMGVIWGLSWTSTWVTKLLSARWLVALGNSSFALYLIHIPMFHLFNLLGLQRRPGAYPVYLGLCIGLSLLSFYFFETPLRSYVLERFHSRTLESVGAASIAQ